MLHQKLPPVWDVAEDEGEDVGGVKSSQQFVYWKEIVNNREHEHRSVYNTYFYVMRFCD